MTYDFHPETEAEFLECVGYYESKVSGLGGALIEEFEALAVLIGESPKAWKVELDPGIRRAPLHRFPLSIIYWEMPGFYKFWPLLMIIDARSTGPAGFNKPLLSDDFSAASPLQTGA